MMRAALVLLVVAVALAAGQTPATPVAKTPAAPAAKPTAAAAAASTAAAKPAGKPTAGKGALGVRQQGDEFAEQGGQSNDEDVDAELVKQVFTSSSPPTSEEALSQEFICSVFGGPSCPDDQPINVPCQCEGDEPCQCVPYYLCDKSSGAANQFGVGVIDIRQGNSSCPHYLYMCCKPPSPVKAPPETPFPGGSGSPESPFPGGSGSPDYRPPETDGPIPKPEDPYGASQPSGGYPTDPPRPGYNPDSGSSGSQHGPDSGSLPGPDYSGSQPGPDSGSQSGPDYSGSQPGPDSGSNPDGGSGLPPSPPGRPRCGQRNPDGIGVRITGDEDGEAQFGEFPWMVAVLKVETSDDEKKRNLYQCGGALITSTVVLTAAHCVKNRISSEQLKVRAGEWDTQTSKEMYRHQDASVEEVVVHPEYYAGAVHNDVALLFLREALHIGYHIGTICMPEQDQNFDYNKCFVSGWGKDKFGQQGRYQVILKKLELPIVPHEQCQDQLRRTRLGNFFVLHHSFICAGGEEGKDTCKGDGGSPLVCPLRGEPGRYQLAGTVAWGIDCGLAGVPGVYGNVALFRNWVDEQLRMHNIDDTPYLP